jgi:hypothetical protein
MSRLPHVRTGRNKAVISMCRGTAPVILEAPVFPRRSNSFLNWMGITGNRKVRSTG